MFIIVMVCIINTVFIYIDIDIYILYSYTYYFHVNGHKNFTFFPRYHKKVNIYFRKLYL